MENKSEHIYRLRKILMATLALYVGQNDDLDDSHVLGAVSATLCDALLIKGVPFDDDLIETLRKTYAVCEIQHAMMDKEKETVQ